MSRFDRFKTLTDLLTLARHPRSLASLAEALDCAAVTVKRMLRDLRERQRMPILYSRERRGYWLDRSADAAAGALKFTESELYALLVAEQLLDTAKPGELAEQLSPLRLGIQAMLERNSPPNHALGERIKVRKHARRSIHSASFQTLADAVLSARMLGFGYQARSTDQPSRRVVAPWRLEYYRDNWYLHAWCTTRSAWRRFAVDRVQQPTVHAQAAHWPKPPPQEAGYGLFAAGPTRLALLKFSAARARWIADENWHPAQRLRWCEDHSLELELPYADPTELILDILRYGDDVEVLKPKQLRAQVREKLKAALEKYAEPAREKSAPASALLKKLDL